MISGHGSKFLCVFLRLELEVAFADGGFSEAFALLQSGDIGGNVVSLVHELGIGLDYADELFAGHLLFARRLLRVAGNQRHDVIVINVGRSEEDEFKINLIDRFAAVLGVRGLGDSVFRAGSFAESFEALGSFDVNAPEGAEIILGQGLNDLLFLLRGEVGVLVELGLEALDFLEVVDEGGAGGITAEVGHGLRFGFETLGPHEVVEFPLGGFEAVDDDGCLVHEPDFAGLGAGLFTGEEGDGGIHGVLLLAKVEDVAVGFGAVEHAVGAGEGLNQAVVLEGLVHIESVQVFGIEAGEEHVHHDGNVDFLGMGQILIRKLLILDALLHVLIVEVELANAVIGAEAGVVVGEDGLEGGFLLLRFLFVVGFFLRQVFLNLLHIWIAFGWRREDAGDIERLVIEISLRLVFLHLGEKLEIFDGVVDGGGGEQGIEPALAGGSVVLGQNGLDDLFLFQCLAGLGQFFAFRFKVIDMEAQNVAVFDGVGDGIGVELLLEEVFRGLIRGLLIFDLLVAGVLLKDGRAGETEELGLREEFFDGLMVVAELGAVAFVEDEDDALVSQRLQLLFVGRLGVLFLLLVPLAVFVQRQTELLDGGDDHLVGIVIREDASHQSAGVGVFLDTAFLEFVELLARLPVEILAVHYE